MRNLFRLIITIGSLIVIITGCQNFNDSVTTSTKKQNQISRQASLSDLPSGADAVWNIVVVGDSSLWGLGDALKTKIEKDFHVNADLYDCTLGGLPAKQVVNALETGKSENMWLEKLSKEIEYAEVIVIFANPLESINPNSPLNIDGCFVSTQPRDCPTEAFSQYKTDLKGIWEKVIQLRKGKPTLIFATDIYNPLIEMWQENDIFEACTVCWENISLAAREAAEEMGIPFYSRFDSFNGNKHTEDPQEKGFIKEDGEHPTDLAGAFTADELFKPGMLPIIP